MESTEVVKVFEWKQGGERPFLRIDHMSTSHLFNVVRMIWNHVAPVEMQLTPFKRYNFGPFYTPEYMAEAVVSMLAELKTRTNLSKYEMGGLLHMQACVARMAAQSR